MAKKNPKNTPLDGAESIESALTKTEQYMERNRKWLMLAVLIIIVAVSGYLAYRNFYKIPREQEAQRQVFPAEQQFEKDSFQVALHGDGNNLGFLQIIEEYSGTKTGNLARYYAGICYRELGDFEQALELLHDYKLTDQMIAPIALGAIGDCYVETDQLEKGLKYYTKATEYKKNSMTTPIFLMKRALLLEESGDWGAALAAYQEIKDRYPRSMQARDIDKYIARATANASAH